MNARHHSRLWINLALTIFAANAVFSQTTETFQPSHPSARKNAFLRGSGHVSRPKIGLVLSGGGARGLAQIGVIRVLEKYNIPIDLIVGNSLGSVVGGLYASGYTTAEIESIAVNTNWAELLSFTEETKRTDLFVGQKQTQEEGYFFVRFNGLEPVIPASISTGQRLLNFFSYLALQALYHPNPKFDDLKIPFRAIATDLISGDRIVLERGSIAEALRASVTVPLLYSPIEKDSMFMVDGGLRSNIPTDVARSLGCDVVIVVNSTSSMRKPEQMKAPWEIADQIMTIMMQESNRDQLSRADVVITPASRERIVSDFSELDSLIRTGELAAESQIENIFKEIKEYSQPPVGRIDTSYMRVNLTFTGDEIGKKWKQRLSDAVQTNNLTAPRLQEIVDSLSATGRYEDLYASVRIGWDQTDIIVHARYRRPILDFQYTGNTLIGNSEVDNCLQDCLGKSVNDPEVEHALENVLRLYREEGYSLIRIDSVSIDDVRSCLTFVINEGEISTIMYEGNETTRDYIIRRELLFREGSVFNINEATQGIINLKSTGLFEYAFLDVRSEKGNPVIVVRVKEKSSELMRIGFHADDEHGIVGTMSIRDINFRGAWEDLGLVMRYGYRNRFVRGEYTVNRIFHSYFTFNLKGYFKSRDVLTYEYAPSPVAERWEQFENGKYREEKYGGSVAFGSNFQRFGDVTAELRLEGHRIKSLSGSLTSDDRYKFASIRFQSTIDTEDRFTFPTNGVMFIMTFESASKSLGSDVGFGKIGIVYENYMTPVANHTLRPRITFGFADKTLPLAEQYHLGGFQSFYGMREDESRGRQLFLINLEYRYHLPFKILFETYVAFRYDVGTISLITQELKFQNFHHGIGTAIAIDTPIGAAAFGVGKSFYFRQDLPNSPVAVGPLLFYFSIGPQL